MNIVREDLKDGIALLKIQISTPDYADKVNASLEKYRKTAKVPGFRPGKVPASFVKQQFGKSVLAEELNRIVGDSIQTYINDNKIDILGQPIPSTEEVKGDFNNPSDFEFSFEIGLTPTFEIPLTSSTKFNYNKVNVDGDLVTKQLDDIRRRYGKIVSSEKVGENELILAQFTELNADGTEKEGGITNSSTVSMEFVEDKKVKKELLDKKIGDVVVVDPRTVSKGESDMKAMLGLKADDTTEIGSKYALKINEIKHIELAELNQELFDKLFGAGEVSSEADLKNRIKNDLEEMFNNDSDRLVMRDAYNHLMDNTTVNLPSDFLKRWITLSAEKPITTQELDEQFPEYEKSMKWQLIQGKIFKDNNLQLKQDEVIGYTKGLLAKQYAQYGIPAPEDKELTDSAMQVLKNQEESARIYDMIAESKLIEYVKSTAKLADKKISYDEFVELANA
jgi:trigger factor